MAAYRRVYDSPAGWLQRTGISSRNLLSVIEYGLPSPCTVLTTDVLKTLLQDHQETFASSSADLSFCSLIQHDIDTRDDSPIKQLPLRPLISARDAEDKTGVIQPTNSAWASPECLVKKRRNFPFLYRLLPSQCRFQEGCNPMHIPSWLSRTRWITSQGLGICDLCPALWVLAVRDDPPCKGEDSILQARPLPVHTNAIRVIQCSRILLSAHVHCPAKFAFWLIHGVARSVCDCKASWL